MACGWTPCLICSSAKAPTARTCRRRTTRCKDLRKHVDEKYRDRMLLAEANQWPEDAVAYFGDGDECHMAFHFPVMPRLFMALRMEDRYPITDILKLTPPIPDNCQWAMFLRNHDELTLEMVTDEERDYMYRTYARDRAMRINLGIRRRLAPLLENDRPRIELMNALLFSLPGTPVLYYGDEIGMGDNIFLGDRNGVRTPMQWSSDRNAGFSRANPQRLYLPVNIDPEYHYETINVEAQQNNSHSLLWFTKRLIQQRKQFQAFGRGTLEFLYPSNRKVLAFIRQFGDETLLIVANLSRFAQCVELDLASRQGMRARSRSSDEPSFPPSPRILTCCRWARMRSTGSTCSRGKRRRSRSTSAARRRSCRCWRLRPRRAFSPTRPCKSSSTSSPECCAPARGSWVSNATSPGSNCTGCWTCRKPPRTFYC